MSNVPAIRIQKLNAKESNSSGEYVLYWMIMNRRTRFNFSLDRAIEWATKLEKPLLIFEALRSGYRWVSDRLHRFVLDGMADNQRDVEASGAAYFGYVEPDHGAGSGLLEALSHRACVVITDDFPCFFIPRMLNQVAPRLNVLVEAVDSNGLLPLRAVDKAYPTAYSFRRMLQKELPRHLGSTPKAAPLNSGKLVAAKTVRPEILRRWPAVSKALLSGSDSCLVDLPIDHSVPIAPIRGGSAAALRTLKRFAEGGLAQYKERRSHPDDDASSGLSPYLHFGHLSAHEIFQKIVRREPWSLESLAEKKVTGKRDGWWGLSEAAESFFDEFITWRELGYNMCSTCDDYAEYSSLPDWSRRTLEKHAKDKRDPIYSLEQFEAAETHDKLWNAAQIQLVLEGRIHNTMRMLWGKKILQWSRSPQEALEIMIHLNNKYAIDGRNPNSYSGIFWCLGRYDRPWGPERPIFGTVRYMSSENMARKVNVKNYLAKYSTPIS